MRGSRHERGYDSTHDRIRARLLRQLRYDERRGLTTPCPRCGQPMRSSQALDAGHAVPLREDPSGRASRLEHAACNRGER